MKKILITGANSYIGTSFEKYMAQWPEKYQVDTVDMIDGTWREKDFSGYDTVFHVAGIAHQKETQENAELYYKINRDLAFDTAVKAKTDGVKQFIFLSSMSVYGLETGVITKETVPTPKSNYGKSKLQAEELLNGLADETFKVAILRPPMVYGKGCKGNYRTLSKLACKLPIFPAVKNERSMLYIDNLSEFVQLMIENEEKGIFWPQNTEYSNTTDLVKMIARVHGKKIAIIPGFAWLLKIFGCFSGIVNKAFGDLIYEQSLSEYRVEYRLISLEKSISIEESFE